MNDKTNQNASLKEAAAKAQGEKPKTEKPQETEKTQNSQKPEEQKPIEAGVSVPTESVESNAPDDFKNMTQEELLQKVQEMQLKNEEMQAENADLTEKFNDMQEQALNAATQLSQLREMSLNPTTEESLLYQVQLSGNPLRFVRASNIGEAQRIYSDFYGINSSEHQFVVSQISEEDMPEGTQHIFVDKDGAVCSKDAEGELIVAGL